ncbi:MAG: NADH-quinone oxidoreductase subunit C [Opitutae bacterium]|nr:NADH-quinone oxidoreductase subunit C [Opitutae bacterium]
MSEIEKSELLDRFTYLSERESSDHLALNCPAEQLIEFCTVLRDEFQFDLLLDVTAIDWDVATPRFTGVYHFYSTVKQMYLRVASDCVDNIKPTLPSLVPLYSAADWHERETYDLMGIHYEGHPNLKRILMWDSYPYHPLRKDFPLAGIETPLPAEDVVEQTNLQVSAAPMMGGPFVSSGDGKMSQTEPKAKDESWNEEKGK